MGIAADCRERSKAYSSGIPAKIKEVFIILKAVIDVYPVILS